MAHGYLNSLGEAFDILAPLRCGVPPPHLGSISKWSLSILGSRLYEIENFNKIIEKTDCSFVYNNIWFNVKLDWF